MNWGFPGGAVVKNLPANAGDTGATTIEARGPTARAPQQEKPPQ